MDCPACGGDPVTFEVPADLREHLPAEAPAAALCPDCLTLHPVEDPAVDVDPDPAFTRIGEAFPTGEAAVPMAMLLGLLDSLAVYRAEVTALLERVERLGADPLLCIDRLAREDRDRTVDLGRRRHQLEQLL
jgi:hypothetical protein